MADPSDVMRRFFAALSTGDFGAIGEFFGDDSVWQVSNVARRHPSQRGRQAIIEDFLRPVREGLFEPGDPKIEVVRMMADGDWVATEAIGRGTLRNGKAYENSYVFVAQVRGERVQFLREYMDTAYAFEVSRGASPEEDRLPTPPGHERGWGGGGMSDETPTGIVSDATPAADGDLRARLIADIRSRREEFEAAGDRAEDLRTLPPETVGTLRDLGAFWLKTPEELGGTPLHPVEFCDVIEELAYADTSTAWACIIGNGCAGMVAGWLPEAGVRRVFPPGGPLPIVAGQPQPRGTGRAVEGGYVVSGRWSFASGILHSGWVMGAFRLDSGGHRMLVFVIPKDQAEVIDNWHVAGLQGTGSLDFSVNDVFVPEEQTYDLTARAVRGGDLFRQELHLLVSNEVPPLCAGLARRALDDMTELASHTARFRGGATLSERAVFHKELGRAEVKVKAARLLHRDAVAAASVFAVETCAEVVTDLFRYGGGRVLMLSNPMQRHLRNALAARQHLAVTEEHYETAGRERIQAAKSRLD
jgi:alkylation response protein AidB-like acyl-CoA dehydrogenase/ketosteroid isomerase-like protein